jgi:hypothetical protein
MSELNLYPTEIHQDRYGGTYSGGLWYAAWMWAEGGNYSRIEEEIANGPAGGDPDALNFWSNPPRWVAVGSTPNEALDNLKSKWDAASIFEAMAHRPESVGEMAPQVEITPDDWRLSSPLLLGEQPSGQSPLALTDAHVRELERAIRAEGYTIHADPETGQIKLERLK